jgi:hypothetical protein
MNAMGHAVPTLIGVDHTGLAGRIKRVIPDYMVMGERGMADMAEMEMPLPENTIPMMTGEGPYGSVEMGGMFSVLKVRNNQKPGDYSNPGWYKQPRGTQAFEWKGPQLPTAPRSKSSGQGAMPRSDATEVEVQVRKPNKAHHGHQH